MFQAQIKSDSSASQDTDSNPRSATAVLVKSEDAMKPPGRSFNTRQFISSIQNYQEIYNPSHPRFKHVDEKNGAWEKVAAEFKVEANFCRKKFRTLRERYTRELRKSYLEPETPVKFEYFKELEFLSPHIKFRSITFESADGKTIVTKREDSTMDKDHVVMEEIQEGYSFAEEPEHTVFLQDAGGTQTLYETTVQHIPEYSGSSQQVHEVAHPSDEEPLSPPKPKDRKRKSSWDDVEENSDDNKYFAMSVACSLKRLSTINNLKAKVEIYQVLEKFSTRQEQEMARK